MNTKIISRTCLALYTVFLLANAEAAGQRRSGVVVETILEFGDTPTEVCDSRAKRYSSSDRKMFDEKVKECLDDIRKGVIKKGNSPGIWTGRKVRKCNKC